MFRFTLSNLLLAMAPIGVFCMALAYGKGDASTTAVVLTIGALFCFPPTLGALRGGFECLILGFAFSFVLMITLSAAAVVFLS